MNWPSFAIGFGTGALFATLIVALIFIKASWHTSFDEPLTSPIDKVEPRREWKL